MDAVPPGHRGGDLKNVSCKSIVSGSKVSTYSAGSAEIFSDLVHLLNHFYLAVLFHKFSFFKIVSAVQHHQMKTGQFRNFLGGRGGGGGVGFWCV